RRLLLIHLDCYEHLLMDSHPPARRPHKSPAHTVTDLRERPQRLIPRPTPKCLTEPHILHQLPCPSTSRHAVFAAAPDPDRPQRGRALCTCANRMGRGFRSYFCEEPSYSATSSTRAKVRLPMASTPSNPGSNTRCASSTTTPS